MYSYIKPEIEVFYKSVNLYTIAAFNDTESMLGRLASGPCNKKHNSLFRLYNNL